MFYAFTAENFAARLRLFSPRRSRDQRVELLLRINQFLLVFQERHDAIELDGHALVAVADSAATLARGLRASVDPYWLGEMAARGVDRGKQTADRRKAHRLIRRLRRDARLLSTALRRAIALPEHQAPIRQGQRTDPRTDELVELLRSAWNRGTGYYPTLSSPESEFARVVLTLADDPAWHEAGLPPLTYRQLRDRITAKALIGRWTREPLAAKKASATSPAKRPKSRK